MATPALSLQARAFLALALLLGFYLLAAALVVVLLALPVVEFRLAERVDLRLLGFSLVAAGAIAKGVMPRRDRFTPPGPRLEPERHTDLFRVVREVAEATRQEMPADVFLIADVNAFVAQRGGVLGVGSRRVMGVGLPLLAALDVHEFRAVIAHEFGHYEGGDTRLGPWVYRTRNAIGRTLEEVAKHSTVLVKPFEWYGMAFLRITHAVSRRQEYVADAVAARVAGAHAIASALRRLERAGAGFSGYWSSEVSPVLEKGFRPPMLEGFRQFMNDPRVRDELDTLLTRSIEDGKSDPYDTHPALRERLAALEQLADRLPSSGASSSGTTPAVTLVDDVAALEVELLRFLAANEASRLEPIGWEEVPSRVLPLYWREVTEPARAALATIRISELSSIAHLTESQPQAVGDRLGMAKATDDDAAVQRAAFADHLVSAALALRLLDRMRDSDGVARLDAPPGAPVSFLVRGPSGAEGSIRPFSTLVELRSGTITDREWIERCDWAGITDLLLADAPTPTVTEATQRRKQPWR